MLDSAVPQTDRQVNTSPVPVCLQQARHILAVAEVVTAPERFHPHTLCARHSAERGVFAGAREIGESIFCLRRAGTALSEHLLRQLAQNGGFPRSAGGPDVLYVLQVMRHAEERRCAEALATAVNVHGKAEQAAWLAMKAQPGCSRKRRKTTHC